MFTLTRAGVKTGNNKIVELPTNGGCLKQREGQFFAMHNFYPCAAYTYPVIC